MNPEISSALSQIVRRCLAKSPDDRFATVADLIAALDSVIQARNPTPTPSLLAVFRRPVVMVIAVLVILAIAAGGWRWSRVRWARTIAAPEVQRLSNHGDYTEAFLLVRQARDVLPDDPTLAAAVARRVPAGGPHDRSCRRRRGIRRIPDAPIDLGSSGTTPLNDIRIPRGSFRVRISKAGFQPIEVSGSGRSLRYTLDPRGRGAVGHGARRRGRGPVRFGLVGVLRRLLDRSIRGHQPAVQGVRRSRRLPSALSIWREPFVDGDRSVSWQEAIERFRDATGQPGPATWKSGNVP